MSMTEKYPLTEKKYPLREPTYKRWQYTLSGWLFLIRTQATEEGAEMERQICARMWEDKEFDEKIRREFDEWVGDNEIPFGNIEKKLLKRKRQSRRIQGKYKGRGKFKGRNAS